MKNPDFLHVDTNLLKLKVGFKNTGAGIVINECAHSGHRTQKLAASHEDINGINWLISFF